jgi:hypothetical protein
MAAIHYTDRGAAVRVGAISLALTQAALAALGAPSILNTQPWRWRIDDDRAELHADRSHRPPGSDPEDRLLTISCGVAMHHARVALAADGVGVDVVRLPDPSKPDVLAVLQYTGPVRREPGAERLRRAIAARRTDLRPFTAEPIPDARIEPLRAAVRDVGARLYLQAGTGPRDAVITTAGDEPADWLIAGEALSAVLLHALAEGLATSSATDLAALVAPARSLSMPAGWGHPAAVVRLGVAGRLDATPRPRLIAGAIRTRETP